MRLDYLILIGLAPPLLYLGARVAPQFILPPVPVPSPATSTPLEPLEFFEGATNGSGTLHRLDSKARNLSVRSFGTRRDDGSLEVTQVIALEGKPERTRTWVLKSEGDNRYSGSLTDAVGDVSALTGGRRMVIAYESEDGNIRQTLTQVDETTLLNRLDVYRWGINVARLEETITKSGTAPEVAQ